MDATEESRPAHERGLLTNYGILKEIQEKLAAIRTDLDSFSDQEAYVLMTSGYRMADHESKQQFANFSASHTDRPEWRFLKMNEAMHDRTKSKKINETAAGWQPAGI